MNDIHEVASSAKPSNRKETQSEQIEYETWEKTDLSQPQFSQLIHELRKIKNQRWARVSITDECITINGKTLNLLDGHSWDLEYFDEKSKESNS